MRVDESRISQLLFHLSTENHPPMQVVTMVWAAGAPPRVWWHREAFAAQAVAQSTGGCSPAQEQTSGSYLAQFASIASLLLAYHTS